MVYQSMMTAVVDISSSLASSEGNEGSSFLKMSTTKAVLWAYLQSADHKQQCQLQLPLYYTVCITSNI